MLTGQRAERAAPDALAPRAVLGLCVSVLAMAMLPFAVTGTNLAIPEIKEDFGSSLAALSWTLSGYSIVLASLTLLGGSVSARLGYHTTFTIGVAIFMLGSLFCMLAPDTGPLIAGRIVQGIGGALVVPASVSVALQGWPDSRRAFAIGIWTAAFPIGSSVAPTLSAVLLEFGSWRLIFGVLAGVGIVTLVLTWYVPRQPHRTGPPEPFPDLLGMVIGTVAVGLLALGIVQGRIWGWSSPETIGVLTTSLLLFPLFVIRCFRQAHPFLPVPLFNIRTFRVGNLCNIFISIMGISVWLVWPLVLAGLWGYSQLQVGLAITPTPIIGGAVTIATGKWCQRHGYRGILLFGAVAMVFAMAWFATHTTVEPNYWTGMFPGLVLTGVGMGCLFAPMNAAALIDLRREDFPSGNATFSTGRFLAGALGISAVVAVLGEGSADPTEAFERAYLFLLGVAVLSLILLVVLWPRRGRNEEPATLS